MNTVFRALTRHSGGCRTICITGGTDKSKQVSWLQEKAPHTVVATPGRLLDLIDDNSLSLGNSVLEELRIVVLLEFNTVDTVRKTKRHL